MNDFLSTKPSVITALHLPDLSAPTKPISVSWLEEYVVKNLEVFQQGGIGNVMLQDETLAHGPAHPETIALMAALGRLARREFPRLNLGIIIQAHDGIAPLAVAHACGAAFVRIKVFVGAMAKSEGVLQACGIAAREYRHRLGREDITIFADVHDRTGVPLVDVPITMAARWAAHTGADALILTGRTFAESLEYLQAVRQAGVTRQLWMGGSVTESNVAEVLQHANGVIASTAFKKSAPGPDGLVLWDLDKIRRFMDVVSQAQGQRI